MSTKAKTFTLKEAIDQILDPNGEWDWDAYHTVDNALGKLYAKYKDQYGMPKHGTTRATFFVSDDEVVKLPLSASDMRCNIEEVEFDKPEIPMAQCSLEYIDDLPCVRMERVRIPDHDEFCRNADDTWLENLWDGPQVGYTKDGRLVAYDLGSES